MCLKYKEICGQETDSVCQINSTESVFQPQRSFERTIEKFIIQKPTIAKTSKLIGSETILLALLITYIILHIIVIIIIIMKKCKCYLCFCQ